MLYTIHLYFLVISAISHDTHQTIPVSCSYNKNSLKLLFLADIEIDPIKIVDSDS